MINKMRNEAIRFEIDMMEKEIVYLKGKRRLRAKRAYYKLLKSCVIQLELDKPIFLMRSE